MQLLRDSVNLIRTRRPNTKPMGCDTRYMHESNIGNHLPSQV